MLRVPVLSSRSSIAVPDRPAHALVRYPDLVEFRAFCPETQPLVESTGVRLCVQVHLGETALRCEFHEALHHGDPGPGAAVLRQYGDATNLTGGFETPCANRVTFCGDSAGVREYVRRDRVDLVPFLAFRNALFLYENSPADALDVGAVMIPPGGFDDVDR
jgi:hypothetical protein